MTIHATQLSPAQPSDELAAAVRLLCAVYKRAHWDAARCREPKIAAEAADWLEEMQRLAKTELHGGHRND